MWLLPSKFNPNTNSQPGLHPSTWWPVPRRHICFGIQPLSKEKKDERWNLTPRWNPLNFSVIRYRETNVDLSSLKQKQQCGWQRPLPECITCHWLSPCGVAPLLTGSYFHVNLSGMKLGFATTSTTIGIFVSETKNGISWIMYFI